MATGPSSFFLSSSSHDVQQAAMLNENENRQAAIKIIDPDKRTSLLSKIWPSKKGLPRNKPVDDNCSDKIRMASLFQRAVVFFPVVVVHFNVCLPFQSAAEVFLYLCYGKWGTISREIDFKTRRKHRQATKNLQEVWQNQKTIQNANFYCLVEKSKLLRR